jgi:predicted nicotinamide N-methyase
MRTVGELMEREIAGLSLLVPVDAAALIDERQFEECDEFLPYWAEVWPSGVALAGQVAGVPGRVLELGCGLGLPSLVAALGGASVVAVDWAEDAVALLRRNAARVGATLDVRHTSWADVDGEYDLVLAADVLYEARNGPPLLAALDRVVAPGGEAWIADPGRAAAPAFFEAAAATWSITRTRREGVDISTLRRRAWPEG